MEECTRADIVADSVTCLATGATELKMEINAGISCSAMVGGSERDKGVKSEDVSNRRTDGRCMKVL